MPELGQVLGKSYKTEGNFFAQLGRKKAKTPQKGTRDLVPVQSKEGAAVAFDLFALYELRVASQSFLKHQSITDELQQPPWSAAACGRV